MSKLRRTRGGLSTAIMGVVIIVLGFVVGMTPTRVTVRLQPGDTVVVGGVTMTAMDPRDSRLAVDCGSTLFARRVVPESADPPCESRHNEDSAVIAGAWLSGPFFLWWGVARYRRYRRLVRLKNG